MTEAETITTPHAPQVKRPPSRPAPWADLVEATLTDWRKRWPAVFTKPVPLAVGFSRQIREALQADGQTTDRKAVGITIHQWTMRGAYLHAVMRGEMRRNLDGSEAGSPDEDVRLQAKKILDERSKKRAERERKERERKAAAAPEKLPA